MDTPVWKFPQQVCMGCGRTPAELDEYVRAAEDEGMPVELWVYYYEMTYDRDKHTFLCNPCFIRKGHPGIDEIIDMENAIEARYPWQLPKNARDQHMHPRKKLDEYEKAIKAYCIECAGTWDEAYQCTSTICPLHSMLPRWKKP